MKLYTHFTNHYLRLLRVNFGRPLVLALKLKGGDVFPLIYYLQRATEGEERSERLCTAPVTDRLPGARKNTADLPHGPY